MIRNTMLVAAAALVAAFPFGTSAKDKSKFDDAVFVKAAVLDGMFEVHLSELAASQTKNADVKKFAAMIQKDHSAVNEELLTAAKSAAIEVPTKLDATRQKQYDAFKDYKGNNFDRDYVKTVVQGHTNSVALFTQASKEATNPTVKAFATKTLPTLQKDLEMAKNLDK